VPDALTTALAAMAMRHDDRRKSAREQALRFCAQMVYRPGEAYLHADADDWLGAVRHRPDSPAVTVPDSAIVLEALLSERH
jgi:hypothetical protein